jgi:hypothetical protein
MSVFRKDRLETIEYPESDDLLPTPDEEREMRRTLEAETARLRQEVEQLLRSKG